MKTIKEITLELDLLFARLFKMDDQIEMLEQQKYEGGQNIGEKQEHLDNVKDEQKQIVIDLKTASSEYWKTL
jgi:hypothetical protein